MTWQEEILQATARGYCTKRNENKTLDAHLLEDITAEIIPVIKSLLKKQREICSNVYLKNKGFAATATDSVAARIYLAPEPKGDK